jgi:predicted Ser/Thr protein kinase
MACGILGSGDRCHIRFAQFRHSMRDGLNLQASSSKLLKKDVFGEISACRESTLATIIRDARRARFGLGWLARRLLSREANALLVLDSLEGVPGLIRFAPNRLEREFIDGTPMQDARPQDVGYFKAAARLLRQMHRLGVAHNDLAKEPNFLVTSDGQPAIIDFQLATVALRRGRLFRTLAREDIRHLLKHKRTYCADALTARERRILDQPAWPAKLWSATGKPVYLFITRRMLGWRDREGAGDRV